MSELATRRMSLAEFLHWGDGSDTRYELIDGFPVAMAPPAEAHRILAMRLGSHIHRWSVELVHGVGAILFLASVDLRVPMSELYEGVALPTADLLKSAGGAK
ncbi:MAG TPA: Uma2 family endonuclease [Stellaceae bacterium]|nr:Uma2 family endonuclease [Stellaceae bacterium]